MKRKLYILLFRGCFMVDKLMVSSEENQLEKLARLVRESVERGNGVVGNVSYNIRKEEYRVGATLPVDKIFDFTGKGFDGIATTTIYYDEVRDAEREIIGDIMEDLEHYFGDLNLRTNVRGDEVKVILGKYHRSEVNKALKENHLERTFETAELNAEIKETLEKSYEEAPQTTREEPRITREEEKEILIREYRESQEEEIAAGLHRVVEEGFDLDEYPNSVKAALKSHGVHRLSIRGREIVLSRVNLDDISRYGKHLLEKYNFPINPTRF